MKYESALELEYRSLLKKGDLPEAQKLAFLHVFIERHEIIQGNLKTRANALLVRLRERFNAEPLQLERTPQGTRANVRQATEALGRLLLVFCGKSAQSTASLLREVRKLKGYEVEEVGGAHFHWAELNRENIRLLHSMRWDVDTSYSMKPQLPDVEVDSRLYPYQKDGVRMLLAGYRLLADEMGTGKTVQSLIFCRMQGFSRVLVVCPASLKLNWAAEIHRWIEETHIEVLGGTQAHAIGKDARYVVINYDILYAWLGELNRVGFDLVISDECHYIQNQGNRRTDSFLKVKANDRLFLSGTPFSSRPIQMFTCLHCIAPDLFPRKEDFGLRYCNPKMNGFILEFNGSSHEEELHRLLDEGICIRRCKADVLGQLPPKSRAAVPMEQRSTAETAQLEELIDECDPMASWEYMKQLAFARKRDACLEWIADFLESGRKLVVFGVHKKALDAVQERFPSISVRIDGSTSAADRDAAVRRFQSDDGARLFIGNIQAAGVGLTLTAASDCCFIEFANNSSAHLQAEDRCHRIGQKDAVTEWYLVAEGTIETAIMGMLQKKASMGSSVMDGRDIDFMREFMKGDRCKKEK